MKRLITLTTIILLVVNGAFGIIISAYQLTNVYLNSAVILFGGIVLWIVSSISLKDAFKYSLTLIFGLIAVVEYILGFFAPSELSNNWFAILMIVILAIESIILLLTNFITNKNE
jgi:hypothetical protein